MTESHAGSARAVGQMTAAMRVLPRVATQKALRIGIVANGQVLEERLLKRPGDVTVGKKESCTFTLNSPSAPESQRLFDHQAGGYDLLFSEAMQGRVVLNEGVRDLDSLKIPSYRLLDGSYRLRLPECARGKIVLGDSVVLFQFVDLPAAPLRPQLPISVREGLSSQIDWRFTVIAAFSFVLHFGLLGMLYSDWADERIDEVATITGVVDTVRSLPPAPPPPDTTAHGSQDGTNAPATPATAKPGATAVAANQPHSNGNNTSSTPHSSGSVTDKNRAALINELEMINLGVVAAVNGSRPATESVLRPGENTSGALEEIAKSASGAREGNGTNLNLGQGSSRVTPGSVRGFEQLVPPPTATAATTGSAVVVKPPPPSTVIDMQPQTTGTVKNLAAVVGQMRPGFRQCYMRLGLDVNPDMQGSVRVTAVIGSNGEVQSVQAAPGGTISAAVAGCIASRVRSAQFDPPAGGTATVIIPVQLRHQ